MVNTPPPEILIFTCLRHEAGYGGHLPSLSQEPPISTHRPPVAKRPGRPPASCLTVLARPSSENRPKAHRRLRMPTKYGYSGTILWDTSQRRHPPRHADPFLSRFSFQVRSPNLAMSPLFRLPGRFDVPKRVSHGKPKLATKSDQSATYPYRPSGPESIGQREEQ